MSAFAWACISEGLNPEPHAFYRVYQARHIPTYDHENHLSPCFGVVEFEARDGFLTPLGSFDPPPFDEWVKDWFYYKYSAIDFYTGKATGIWITNNFEPPQNSFISRCVDAFRRVSQRMTLRDILEECFAAGVLPLAHHGWRPSSFGRNKFGLSFNLWSPQDRVISFLGKFSQKEWVESTRRGIGVRINRFYLSFDLCLHNRLFPEDNSCEGDIFPYFSVSGSSTVEMDPSLVVVTPEVESVPRNAEIPSPPPGSLLMPTYFLIFEEPSPDDPSNSAAPPVVPDTVCGGSSLIPSEVLRRFPTVVSDVVRTDGIVERSELVNSCQLLPEGSKGTFCPPRKSSFLGLLGKRKLSEVSTLSQDIISSLGTALPSIHVAVSPSQTSNPGALSSGSLELDVEAMLSSMTTLRLRVLLNLLPVRSGFRRLSLACRTFRVTSSSVPWLLIKSSFASSFLQSIILTQACARELQNSFGDLLLASSLEASLSAKDDSLKVSSAAASDLLAEVEVLRSHKFSVVSDLSILEEKIREKKASLEKEKLFNEHLSSHLSKASQLKIVSADNSFAKSLALCDLLKELFQALGAKYDEVPANVSLEVMNEWLRLNLVGLAEICRSFSFDAVVLRIRDLLHSFSCEGSDAVALVGRPYFSMKPSDLSHDFGAVEGKCVGLINDFWWNRVKCLVPDFPEDSS
ncbi:hypothetical protein EJB05_30685, partial [Eragrostis curvula]